MELYGSLLNISGSVTASTFTGSFIGDGSGLTGIRASGVTGLNLSQISTGSVSASLSSDGFNVNTNTSITGAVNITGSISLNGEPIGTGKLNETTFQAYTSSNDGRVAALETSSGSLNSFTSSINTTIKSKLDNDGVISGSVQVNITGTTGYSTFSSSISSSIGDISSSIATTTNNLSTSIATTDLNQTNRLISIENKTGSYATTGSNLFIGTQTHSGSIIPSVDNEYDLGSVTHQWRDVYISSGSLYIDGTKVISSTAQELQITTDSGQSIKILEGGTDSIILQTADGNVELKSNADGDILLDPTNGKIVLKGTIEVLNGQKIQSSVGGTPIVFANDIVVSGSIDITGTIEGINLTDFSSSVNTRVSNLESGAGSLNAFTASATTRLNSLETTTGSLNSYTSSNNTRLGVIETATSSLNSFTSSINTTIKNNLNDEDVISGSIQVNIGETTGYASFSSSIAITDLSQTNRLNSIEGKSGSYATTGSNVFIGDQTITGSLFISQNLIVQGSSSLENITASAVSIGTNTIILNTDTPAFRYAGISVFDSGSTNVTASLFYDSLTNQWKFKHTDVGTSDASIMLFGPLGDDIDNTPLLASNYLTKVEGTNDHGHHLTTSSILDNGSKVSINSNTEITGTFVATGTALVSGSAQVLNGTGIFSGSAQLPSGLVSGSSQVLAGTTIHSGSFFNGITVVSGSGQISFGGITDKPALVSGSAQISFGGITDKPALVSGSSQISFNSISDRPALVSGSAQIDLTATTNYSTGIKTRLNAEGVISGSSQVTGIGNPQLVNPSFHVGTTSISLGRASASQTLTGVSIDGNATSETLATVTARGASTTTDLTFNGSLTMGTGGTQFIRMGRFPASTTNSGEAWIGRASDRSVGTMTVQLGTGANRNFEIVDHAWSTVVFNAGMDSITYKNNVVWHAGNDGASSGLDADLLDGSHASAFSPVAGSSSITTVGTITSGVWNGTAIANANLANPSFHVGTTSISLGRASAAQTLTGVSIDGNADTVDGLHETSFLRVSTNSSSPLNGNFAIGSASSRNFIQSHSGQPLDINPLGNAVTVGSGLSVTGAISASNFSGTSSGTNTGDQTNISGNAGTVTNGVYTTGDQTIGGTKTFSSTIVGSVNGNSATVGGLSPIQFFNNMGGVHGTRTSFDASTPSYDFGWRYVQGSTNGPGTGGGLPGQFYSVYVGLGNDYPATGSGSYGMYLAIDRNSDAPYLSVRYNENNSLSTWRKIRSGYADTAGTAGNITAYTINQSVGSSNTPQFAGVDLTSRLYMNAGSYEGSILFGSSTTWRCGIRQHDDADAELRIWAKNANGMIFLATGYDGEPADISRPTDGLVVVSNNVGIGNFSAGDPSYKLHVKGTAGIENNLTVGGTLTENSSIRYKKDIETISYGLDKVLKMRGVTYLKKENDIKEVGVIAEEIAEIFPELVNYDTEGRPDSVSYGRITGLLIEAIKDLKKEINELKNNG